MNELIYKIESGAINPFDIVLVLLLAAIGALLISKVFSFIKSATSNDGRGSGGFSFSILLLGLIVSIIASSLMSGGFLIMGLFFFAAKSRR